MVYNSAEGEKNKAFGLLEANNSKTLNVTIAEIAWGFGGGTYGAKFRIEYTINDIIFNSGNNDDGTLFDNSKTVITINNDGYTISS